jgi:hypothetical protein
LELPPKLGGKMPRIGKIVDAENPTYLLDKNRGFSRIPTVSGNYLEVRNLKFLNRDAYDANFCEFRYKGESFRVQKDELLAMLQYV